MVDASRVASMNPDNMVQTGLADDFDGVIKKVRLVPWNYAGTLDHYILGIAMTIKPDSEEEFVQYYPAGDLEHWMPSMDGDNPVNLDGYGTEGYDPAQAEGIYAIKVGKQLGLSNSSNWAYFLIKAREANFPVDRITADVSRFEGTYAHFNRIPQKVRAGLVKAAPAAGEKKRSNDILVITEFKGFVDQTGVATKPGPKLPTSSAKPATSAPATSSPSVAVTTTSAAGGDLDTKLVAVVKSALAAAEPVDGVRSLSKAKLPAAALKSLAATDKGKGVKRVVDADFLAGHEEDWYYDPETGTLMEVSA